MGSSQEQPAVLQLLPAGPHVLRTLPKQTARPDPESYLRKNSAVVARSKTSAASRGPNKWPVNQCPTPQPCFNTDRTKFAVRQKPSSGTQFRRLYDLGLIDFVSVRWQCHNIVVIWRTALSPAALKFFLPIFVAGTIEEEEPYHFLALRGALDMIRALGPKLADAARDVAVNLRQLLLWQCPARCADACLLLSHICQESPAGALALRPHFRLLGPGLNRFVRCRSRCVFGGRSAMPLCECVWHVLRQLEECGGRGMRGVLQRHVPLYEGPVDGGWQCRGGGQMAW
eukprot:jgi/Ulvmu1/9196/UM005_0296.1